VQIVTSGDATIADERTLDGRLQRLSREFGRDDVTFSITWTESAGPGWTRTYERFSHLAEEAARSRVYGGIHFNFDTTSSFGVCGQLGDYICTNTLRRR
jgi:hypothetical protein